MCRVKLSASMPSSVTMKAILCAIRPEMRCKFRVDEFKCQLVGSGHAKPAPLMADLRPIAAGPCQCGGSRKRTPGSEVLWSAMGGCEAFRMADGTKVRYLWIVICLTIGGGPGGRCIRFLSAISLKRHSNTNTTNGCTREPWKMSNKKKLSRPVLPIPDRAHVGLTTYDAKDPDTKFPPMQNAAARGRTQCPHRSD